MSQILYIAQFFSLDREPGGQGQRHYKHAVALAENGHAVTVITGGGTTMSQPSPAELARAEQARAEKEGLISAGLPESLRIIRLPARAMRKRSVLNRALAYFDFSGKALWTGLKLAFCEKQHYGFVLGSSPPLLVALVAYLLSLVFRAKFYMEVRDLWSQTMSANGFITNRWAIELNRAIESWLYRQSAQIIILSPAFGPEIEAQTPGSHAKTEYIPNGADMEFYQYPQLWNGSYLRDTAEHSACFHVNYAGVYSDYTHLETLLEAASLVQTEMPDIHFNLVGGGYQFEKLNAYAQELGLHNVTFWDALPKTRISKFLMEGDLSIINYRNLKIFGQVLPNKLYDYLAAGRPILAAAPEGEVCRVIEASGAGKTVPPENAQAIAEAIAWFYRNPETGLKMGLQGQQYVLRHFNRKHLIERLLNLFPKVIPMPIPDRQAERVAGSSGIASSGRKNHPTP
jgi:glycosyltransferase involved in cell wall biosynthesis